MEAAEPKAPAAWQPLTPRGVAAFASARLGRLLVVQLVVAMMVAGTVIWCLQTTWFPTVTAAISQLPERGEVRSGRLDWRGESPDILAENRFLAVVVDLPHSGEARSPAHIQVEFGQTNVYVISLLGYLKLDYRRDRVVSFNSIDLRPWWGAWAPEILAITAGLVVAGLMIVWTVLATVYFAPVWLLGFFANRALSSTGGWLLAGAALMPGAFVMVAAFIAYGLGMLDPVQLILATAAHFVIGWVYLFISPFYLPRHPDTVGLKTNPFDKTPGGPSPGLPKN